MTSFHDLMGYINDGMNEDGATTMDAVSYLPTQVGVVRSAIMKLKKLKNKWDLEILESEDGILVQFEDKLKIDVALEDWESFQEIFDGALDNGAYLDLQTLLRDSIDLDSEEVLENRKEEFRLKVMEGLDSKEVQAAVGAAEKWVNVFGCKENIASEALVPLNAIQEWSEKYFEGIFEDYEDDLGYLEMLIEKFDPHSLSESECLTGIRYRSEYEGIGLVFEVKVSFEKNCSFSIQVGDSEVADNLEEACLYLQRAGNVFYPRFGQIASPEGVFETLKDVINDSTEEVIEDTGEENEE